MSLGRSITAWRTSRGMTQIDLVAAARKSGGTFTERALQYWENDERSPRFEHMQSIARALGITTDDLVCGPCCHDLTVQHSGK